MKRVTLIGPSPPPAGGMANLTKKLIGFIEGEGLIVNFIAMNSPYRPAWVEKIPGIRALFRLIPYLVSLYRETKHTDVVHIMANSGWSWHLFSAPAILIAKLHNKKVVVNYHGGNAESFFQASWRIVNLSLRKADDIWVPTDYLKEVFAKFDTDVCVVPNTVDDQLFKPSSRKFQADGLHIVVTRNLEKIYGIDQAIRVFDEIAKIYPDARLSIAGTGEEKGALENLVSELKLESQVRFLGRLTLKEVSALYHSADILLNTSLIDNAPSSLLEGQKCGLLVASYETGGIPWMLTKNVDAVLTPVGAVNELSCRIVDLIENSEKRMEIVNQGLISSEKYNWCNVWPIMKARYFGESDISNSKL